jgi:ferritin-like metal-binding protein YciE
MAMWFFTLGAVTAAGALAATAENLALFAVLATLAAGSVFLAIGDAVGSTGWVKLAGWVLVVSAGLAYYVATAMMLAASAGKVLLPLGKPKLEANKPGAQPVRPIELDGASRASSRANERAPQPPQIDSADALLRKQMSKLITIKETLARTVLPKLQQEAQDQQLQQAFADHLKQTRGHVDNLRTAFAELGASASGGQDKVLDAAKEERKTQVQQLAPALRDGFNASTAMGTEHHEIAEYEAAIRLAEALGQERISTLLRANLSEEVEALEKLAEHATRLARQGAQEPAVR